MINTRCCSCHTLLTTTIEPCANGFCCPNCLYLLTWDEYLGKYKLDLLGHELRRLGFDISDKDFPQYNAMVNLYLYLQPYLKEYEQNNTAINTDNRFLIKTLIESIYKAIFAIHKII